MSLKIRKAKNSDIEQLVELINSAYRHDAERSWTTEKNVVQGDRITKEQLDNELRQPNFELLVGEERDKGQIIACIGLSLNKGCMEIGTFAVDQSIQNQGYGREMLNHAEAYIAQIYPEIRDLVMHVLDVRKELVAYYQRRGYQITGRKSEYPIEANVGQPLVPIQLIELKKYI
ncbi:GNAT family N-acetyltransferase [Acinetobacter sp. ANC 3882]|uniref:GNAT family N-acetyltransferase n=1 Tax=Acinetobacter sp. ANC 3882 TaxID=2923423 RepID=UPI001F4BA1DF|nr:GNAT family N-acetyltransferase [Acinetobacter sp. ANC 3882]MCH7312937.1 GNAT family N-acetyltransferase [Acinetobacter sp. ANC 3882]